MLGTFLKGEITLLFNELGRIIPSKNCRVFSDTPKEFYKTNSIDVDYTNQHRLALKNGLISDDVRVSDVLNGLANIVDMIDASADHKNLLMGSAIPFSFSMPKKDQDLGVQLESFWLPLLKRNYEQQCASGGYFKATLQGNTKLEHSVKIADGSGYDLFLEKCTSSTVVGYYFPTVFQEFDIQSQRSRITELKGVAGLEMCLSGPFEIIYSLISYPNFLFNSESYSPILCASAVEHVDPRMVLMFKSYGPHLECWLMTQMLTPTKTQVSEQWSGGLTIYKTI